MNQQGYGAYNPFKTNAFFTGCTTSFNLVNLEKPAPLLKLLTYIELARESLS